MIDERFSAAQFAKCGLDSKESGILADLLEEEVNRTMRRVIEENFKQIVENLNSMGHNLRLYQESGAGEISFRDEYVDGDYRCKLRLAFDYVTSAGYSDLMSENVE